MPDLLMYPNIFIKRKNDVKTTYKNYMFSGVQENSTMTCIGFKIEKKILFQ